MFFMQYLGPEQQGHCHRLALLACQPARNVVWLTAFLSGKKTILYDISHWPLAGQHSDHRPNGSQFQQKMTFYHKI